MKPRVVVLCLTLAISAWGLKVAWDYFDPSSVANRSIQVWLKMIGEGYYEYHARTGKWPQRVADLSETSLPERFPRWRSAADAMVFQWPMDLQDDPKKNAGAVIAYYNAGLYSRFGRKWVLFGDLRTEFLTAH